MAFDIPQKPTYSQIQQAGSSAVKKLYTTAETLRSLGEDANAQKKERERQREEMERATANKGNVSTSQRR